MGTWVEIDAIREGATGLVSSPAWGRGLKYQASIDALAKVMSSPAWGRGLKYFAKLGSPCANRVVPRVGTWVEI